MKQKHHNKNGTEVHVNITSFKDFEFFVRKFNKRVQKSGILVKYMDSRFYEKPSKKKNRKLRESILRTKKEQRKLDEAPKRRLMEEAPEFNSNY